MRHVQFSRLIRSPASSRWRRGLLAAGLGLACALELAAQGTPIFVEPAGAGLDFVHYNGMSGRMYFAEMAGPGGALADVDGDGDLDLFLVQGSPLGDDRPLSPPRHQPPYADRLYLNRLEAAPGGGRRPRFRDVTASALPHNPGYGMGVAAGDYDNDGRVDFYVTRFGENRLLRNLGPGDDGAVRFEDAIDRAGARDRRWSVAAVFVDYDRDGWLDLFVVNYVQYQLATHKPCRNAAGAEDYCGPHAYPPAGDRLYRNLGPGADGTVRFEDVTEQSGLGAPAPGLGAVAVDVDGDGWLDLYVANDGAPNQLWRNQGRGAGGRVTFADEALFAGCAVDAEGQPQASMGIAVGDVERDGDLDLFLTHLTRETNTLYLNDGRGLFRDASLTSGLGTPSWPFTGFGTAFLDYDNDGWLDLLAVNGAVTVIEEQAKAGERLPLRQRNQLFHNRGDGSFVEVTEQAGSAFQRSEVSRGVAVGDVDDDGDADVVLLNNDGPARLLLNRLGQERSWIGLRLLGARVRRDQLGARVTIYPQGGGPPLVYRVATDGSYASASDPRVLAGLGDATAVRWVDVVWPDGRRERFSGLAAGRYHVLRQGGGTALP
ncbi:MAG: CRTAC1 family protein [Acidobacteria bacterium]|nr:MAG: CRTAC1 family protein [Acidobacteriota bacterium]